VESMGTVLACVEVRQIKTSLGQVSPTPKSTVVRAALALRLS
jgi:hypothetical protein